MVAFLRESEGVFCERKETFQGSASAFFADCVVE